SFLLCFSFFSGCRSPRDLPSFPTRALPIYWNPSSQSRTRTASDALLQSIDLAVAAEELGADGAYFRVHHFARQLGSPFPLLAARSEEHTSELQSRENLVCRLLLDKKK